MSASAGKVVPPDGGVVTAIEAYTGAPFARRRAYAERFGRGWLIFSAKFGLLTPTDVVDPRYDIELGAVGSVSSQVLREQIRFHGLATYPFVEVIAGEKYVDLLRRAAVGLGVSFHAPLYGRGLSMGEFGLEVHRRVLSGQPFDPPGGS